MNDQEIILSLETSGSVCGVAISDNNGLISSENVSEKNLHDKILASMIRDILLNNNISIHELSAVALSGGPGSFTGLRIGAALAKGICFDDNIKFVPVSTLEAFAWSVIHSGYQIQCERVIVTVHSHKNLYYIQEFSTNFEILSDIKQIDINQLLSARNNDALFCGPGTYQVAEYLDNHFDHWDLSKLYIMNHNVEIIDKYARKNYHDNKFVNVSDYVPNYYQDFIPKNH